MQNRMNTPINRGEERQQEMSGFSSVDRASPRQGEDPGSIFGP